MLIKGPQLFVAKVIKETSTYITDVTGTHFLEVFLICLYLHICSCSLAVVVKETSTYKTFLGIHIFGL